LNKKETQAITSVFFCFPIKDDATLITIPHLLYWKMYTMKLTNLFFASLFAFLFISCDNDELTQEEYQLWLDKHFKELVAISESVTCTNSAEWKILAIAHQVCADFSNYIAYHPSIDTDSFFEKVEIYNDAVKAYHMKWKSNFDCIMHPGPYGIECIDGKATFIYNYSCGNVVLIENDAYNSANADQLTVHNIELTGNCLSVNYSSSGCGGSTWILQLIDSGAVMESDPPQRILRFNFINNELCEAYFEKTSSFDISSLKAEGDETLLNIAGWDEAFFYD